MKKLPILFALVAIVLSACGAPAPAPTAVPSTAVPPTAVPPTAIPSTATLEPCSEADQVNFESINFSNEELTFFWVNFDNQEESYGTAKPGERFSICTMETHKWIARNAKGELVLEYIVTAESMQRVDIVVVEFVNYTDNPVKVLLFDIVAQTAQVKGDVQPGDKLFLATQPNQFFLISDMDNKIFSDYTVTDEIAQTFDIGASPEALAALEEKLKTDVDTFKNNGYIASTDGTFIPRDDISADLNEVTPGRDWTYYPLEALEERLTLRNFVYSAHFKWSTAAESSEKIQNGCGVTFGLQESSGDHFAVFLGSSEIIFAVSQTTYNNNKSGTLGATSGTGRVSFGNPAEADFTFIVNENKSYVFVDSELIGEYDLPVERALEGIFSQAAVTSITEGYGTHCEISNAGIWALK